MLRRRETRKVITSVVGVGDVDRVYLASRLWDPERQSERTPAGRLVVRQIISRAID